MTLESLLASVALEYKYHHDPITRTMLIDLYRGATGKNPAARQNILKWFLTNYEFDEGADAWYHRERKLPT